MSVLHLYHGNNKSLVEYVQKRLPQHHIVAIESEQDFARSIHEMVVLFTSVPPRGYWKDAKNLQWIQLSGVGVDHVLLHDTVPEHIEIATARGVFAVEVSEYVLGMMLATVRNIPAIVERQLQHEWKQFPSPSLRDKQVLLVGMGEIGKNIARRCLAFEMRVTGYCRTAKRMDDVSIITSPEDFYTLLPNIDFLVICAPKTPLTTGLINHSVLSRLSQTCVLINVARGGIVDEDALFNRLIAGELGGAVMDVFEQEPLPEDHRFWDAPNTIVTSHLAGVGIHYMERVADRFVENVELWQQGRLPKCVVNRAQGY